MSIITIQSSDNHEFIEVEEKLARMSKTISNMIDEMNSDSDHPLLFHNINSRILTKIFDYCKYYEENHKPDEDYKTAEFTPWQKEFCNMDNEILFQLIVAANFLEIRPLLAITCRTVASMVKGKTIFEIRDQFRIPDSNFSVI
jgi:S-phase kinase-associated protein 1